MLIKKLLVSFVFLLSFQAWGETLYVCPTTVNTATSAGSSPTTDCFDGTADVSWGVGAGSVSAGDTLCVVGTFTGATESDVSGITLRVDTSGSDANTLVTVDGDCDGDGVKAEFDGNNAVAIGIRAFNGAVQSTYLLVKNIVLRQYTNKAIVTYNVTGDETANAYQTWDEIEVYDHGDGGAADNGFDSRGRYITLTNSSFSGIDEDAVYHKGKYFRADNIYVRDYSRATTGGDGIQLAGEIDGYHVSNFDCAHDRDTKQCFITSGLTDTGANGIFEDFTTHCLRGAVVTNCIFVTGDGATIRRGYITGGNFGVAVEASAMSVNMKFESLLIDGATLDNFGLFTDTGGGNISVTNVTSINAGRYAFNGSTGPSATYLNNIAVNSGTCGFNLSAAGQTESYNNSYTAGLDEFCQVGVGTSAGTGSVSVDPGFIGGTTPTTAAGFRLSSDSPLRRVGADLNRGNVQDYGNRAFSHPPSIGAWEVTSGDSASSRTTASTRTVRN